MNAKEIKKIIADHVFCADTDAHRVLGIGDAATAIEKHIATLETANAELKRKGDALARWAGAVVSDFTWELNSTQQLSMIAKQERIEKLDAALREWEQTQ